MSIKDTDLDIMAEAFLPSDLLTPTLGSNYGMEGYEDMQYNMGVLEAVVNPEFHPPPALPTGLARAAAAEMDLKELMAESALADLNWLDPEQPQDPSRLPEQKELIPELVQAWGVNRRTDGVTVAHQKDLARAQYEASLDGDHATKRINARTMEKVLTQAMRRSIEGQSIDRIVREACDSVGDSFQRIVPHLRMVQADHGLAGNVFIRAAAYPGWGAGKWKKHAKTHASKARYIIVSDDEMKQATWIQDGRCTYTGKKAVVEVPWKKAMRHYGPRLEAVGRKVASGDPREALRSAFLTVSDKTVRESSLPREERLGSEVDFGSALRQQFDVATEAVTNRVAHAAEDEILWDADTTQMAQRVREASDVKAVVDAVEQDRNGKIATYGGSVFGTAPQTRSQTKLSAHNEALAKAASAGNVRVAELRGVLRGVRQAMSEGMAGKDLTGFIKHRFASSVVKAAKGLLKEARQQHEGGAGFLYVDAEAYASPQGIQGCEKAASKHRANQIPAVAAMDRCAGCSLVRELEDGTRKCGVYNKALLEDIGGDDIAAIKASNVKQADMSDAEATASYFAPKYDPSEFGLHNANLENIEAAPLGEVEQLSEVVFGGWDI